MNTTSIATRDERYNPFCQKCGYIHQKVEAGQECPDTSLEDDGIEAMRADTYSSPYIDPDIWG